jgi:hypothetical protein
MPGTHQPATPLQPTKSQLSNNQPDDIQLAKNQLVDYQPANLPSPDLTLEQFFTICKITFHDRQIQVLIKKNMIYHWSVFEVLGVRRIENLGFKLASGLIVTGTLEAIRLTKANP